MLCNQLRHGSFCVVVQILQQNSEKNILFNIHNTCLYSKIQNFVFPLFYCKMSLIK